jgi:CMP-N,N'-diacetyllegionaminic acid synthase
MEIITLIPARGGSKGVPKKNIRDLQGFPLIAYSIVAAQLSTNSERVIVSTDSEEIAEIAKKFGAEVPFMRPAEFANDNSTDKDVVVPAMNWFLANEGHCPEYWVYLRPTTPLRTPEIIDMAISEIMKKLEATSLRSGHKCSESPYKWFKKSDSGYFEGINPEDNRPEYYNLPRQAFTPVYIPNGYVDILKASHALNSESLNGNKMIGFETPVCYEVDTAEDFELIQYQIGQKGSLLLDYLQHHNKKQNGWI